MTFSLPRFTTSLALASLSFLLIPAAFAAPQNRSATATYQPLPANIDYRDVSTLSEFTRLVYKDRWTEIEAADVLEQFSKFNGIPQSPAMRDTWRDIALGDFNGLEIDNNNQQLALMTERLRILNQLGFFDEAVRLYQQAAQKKPIPEALARQGIESLALSGSADGACLEVTMAAQDLSGDQWDQDAALCEAYFGDKKQAAKHYDKTAKNAGSGFRAVYKLLSSNGSKAIQVGIPPLWRTLLLAQNATVTSGALKDADAVTLASLASNPKVPLGTRIAAASRGADRGTVGADRLRGLYETQYPSDTGLDGTIQTALANGNLSASSYYAAARFTFKGYERGTISKNGMHRNKPITHIKNQVYGWIIDKLTLQINKMGFFAPEGYANMITTNRVASANMYYDVGNLRETPLGLIHALIQGQPWSQEDQQAWQQGMRKQYKDKADTKINEFMMLAKAYDQENKLQLYGKGYKQNLSINHNSVLYSSVDNGGKGLTLMASLNFLASYKQISSVQTAEFIDIIETMTKEGLFGERKKIMLEFLIETVL